MGRRQLFISYSHKDKECLHEQLLPALRAAIGDLDIEAWSDEQLQIGENFKKSIAEKIASSDAAILLLSNDFFASSFIREEEWPRLLDLADKGGTYIFPVHVRHCRIPEQLRKRHILPGPEQALATFTGNDLDRELTKIASSIAKRFESAGTAASPRNFVSPPRRGLWAAGRAYVSYRRLRRKTPAFEAAFAERARQSPNSLLSDVIETFESRPSLSVSSEPVDVIVGASGTGKSTALRQLLSSLNDSLMLPLDVRGLNDQEFGAELWRQLVMNFWRGTQGLDVRGVARALQHVAQHRQLVIIAEDIDDFGDLPKFVDGIRTFFETKLRWPGGVKVLATARTVPEERVGGAHVTRLEPLSTDEARHLFWRLCRLYGVDVDAAGAALENAFVSSATRTPLVVHLSAVLARERGGAPADVEKILGMRVAALLQQLVDTLSSKDARGAGAVLAGWYRAVGVAVWPEWENIRIREISRKTRQAVDAPKVKELTIRGLLALEKPDVRGDNVAFPHRAMVDYLLATDILENRAVDAIAREPESASEGVVDFLYDLCDTGDHLLTLARADLRLLLRFYRRDRNYLRNPRFGDRTALLEGLARTVAQYVEEGRAKLAYDEWSELCRIATEASAVFAPALSRELETQRPSVQGGCALVALRTDHAMQIAHDWLRRDAGILSGIDHSDLHSFYGATVAAFPLSDAAAATAFKALLRSGSRDQYKAVVRRLNADVARLSEQAVDIVASAGDESLALLAFACARTTSNVRRRIAVATARTTGYALVPATTYHGVDIGTADEPRVDAVHISAPLLVELSARSVTGPNWGEASKKALAQVSVDEVLDYDELCVLQDAFRDGLDGGFNFPPPGSMIAEIVRMHASEKRSRHLSFAWITSDRRVTAIMQSPRDRPATILVRRIRRLSAAAGRVRHFAGE